MSKRLGLASLASMDATTRQDIAQLATPRVLPCAPGAKCEACVGECQPLLPIEPPGPPGLRPPAGQQKGCNINYEGSGQSWIERTRYSVPASKSEVLLYRNAYAKDGSGRYFCYSTRARLPRAPAICILGLARYCFSLPTPETKDELRWVCISRRGVCSGDAAFSATRTKHTPF